MVYRVIGLMSGSSLDGLDIVYVHLQENAGKWKYDIKAAGCLSYSAAWETRLRTAVSLPARDYLLLHSDYGHYIGEEVNRFIRENGLDFQVQLIASHGHTVFHLPGQRMTAQLGDGAAIAAVTGLPVVTDLRALDVALGGQGAPIVPIGEQLLLGEYNAFLNIGGIANLSVKIPGGYVAFDVCPANRVLNMLANEAGKGFDEGGVLAAGGNVLPVVLAELNALSYYGQGYPKSLANDFGTDVVFPLVRGDAASVADLADALRTYVEHIVVQVKAGLERVYAAAPVGELRLLVTGGGALNTFLVEQLRVVLAEAGVVVVVPEEQLVSYKEALVMALIGILRWRQEDNVLCSATGAVRDSIGGALWNGQDA